MDERTQKMLAIMDGGEQPTGTEAHDDQPHTTFPPAAPGNGASASIDLSQSPGDLQPQPASHDESNAVSSEAGGANPATAVAGGSDPATDYLDAPVSPASSGPAPADAADPAAAPATGAANGDQLGQASHDGHPLVTDVAEQIHRWETDGGAPVDLTTAEKVSALNRAALADQVRGWETEGGVSIDFPATVAQISAFNDASMAAWIEGERLALRPKYMGLTPLQAVPDAVTPAPAGYYPSSPTCPFVHWRDATDPTILRPALVTCIQHDEEQELITLGVAIFYPTHIDFRPSGVLIDRTAPGCVVY